MRAQGKTKTDISTCSRWRRPDQHLLRGRGAHHADGGADGHALAVVAWRHLLTRVPVLRFFVGAAPKPSSAQQYISINGVLARRAETGAHIDDLVTSLLMVGGHHSPREDSVICASKQYFSPCINATADVHVHVWLRYGMCHAIKSFTLELSWPWRNPTTLYGVVQVLGKLPSHTSVEAVRLTLGLAFLKLPTTVAFDSLTDFSLGYITFDTTKGQRLGRSCRQRAAHGCGSRAYVSCLT